MDSIQLPPEILIKIFSPLYIDDRKRVRLVCKIWNECCNCPAILRKEKFVFRRGCYLPADIDSFLRHCGQIRDTVEFISISLDKLSGDIWQIIGENICTLTLTQCMGTSEEAKNILLHCSKMHSFTLSHTYRHRPWRWQPSFIPDERFIFCVQLIHSLDELIKLKIQRPQLTNFQVFFDGKEIRPIPKHTLSKIFMIFPCIRNFGAGYSSYLCYNSGDIYRGSLRNAIKPALIKEMLFNVPTIQGLWLQELINVPELKLQKLETILDNATVPSKIITQFFQNQPELKTLKINLTKMDPFSSKTLLNEILSLCSELTHFCFKCDEFLLTIDELYRILLQVSKSKLECFMLWFLPWYADDQNFNPEGLSAYLPPLVNKRLHTLKLYAEEHLLDCFCLPILEHFCNLHHLEMAIVSDEILPTISEYHIHLQTLILRIYSWNAFGPDCMYVGSDDSDSSVGAQETVYSISQLQELTHLELNGSGTFSHHWIEYLMQQFNFPRLKFLSLRFKEPEGEKVDLEYLPAMIPSVEGLIFDEFPIHEHQYVYICKSLPRLKFLIYPWKAKVNIKELFAAQPSLKYYAINLVTSTYFYDRFSKELRTIRSEDIELGKSVFSAFF